MAARPAPHVTATALGLGNPLTRFGEVTVREPEPPRPAAWPLPDGPETRRHDWAAARPERALMPHPPTELPPERGPEARPFAVTERVACLGEGTRIAVPGGLRAVETLGCGDPVLTADGRTVRLEWVGVQTVDPRHAPEEHFRPVRIAAGALGDGVPLRDLFVTADLALALDGLLVQAGALLNGTTVTRPAAASIPEHTRYWQLETPRHEILLAEGAAAESFVDHVALGRFAAAGALGAGVTGPAESDLPRVERAGQMPRRLRHRLAALAAREGAAG